MDDDKKGVINMVFSICILALSLSIDALGVGMTYGLRKVKIPLLSAIIICMFSILYSGAAIFLGKYLSYTIPPKISKLLGIIILIIMGCWIILQSLIKNKGKDTLEMGNNDQYNHDKMNSRDKTLLKIVIKSLGITIQVLRNPSECDIDKSGIIDIKESLLLGLALSVDAVGVGIGSALSGFHSSIIPFAVGLFQMVLLRLGTCIGNRLGENLADTGKVKEKFMAIIPGILLIILAIIRTY